LRAGSLLVMHLIYIDDSKDEKIACFLRPSNTTEDWHESLTRFISIRRLIRDLEGGARSVVQGTVCKILGQEEIKPTRYGIIWNVAPGCVSG
jgi:hypothetical protein